MSREPQRVWDDDFTNTGGQLVPILLVAAHLVLGVPTAILAGALFQSSQVQFGLLAFVLAMIPLALISHGIEYRRYRRYESTVDINNPNRPRYNPQDGNLADRLFYCGEHDVVFIAGHRATRSPGKFRELVETGYDQVVSVPEFLNLSVSDWATIAPLTLELGAMLVLGVYGLYYMGVYLTQGRQLLGAPLLAGLIAGLILPFVALIAFAWWRSGERERRIRPEDSWPITVRNIKPGFEDEVESRIVAVGGQVTAKRPLIRARVAYRVIEPLERELGRNKTVAVPIPRIDLRPIIVENIEPGYESKIASRIVALGGRVIERDRVVKAQVPYRMIEFLQQELSLGKTGEISYYKNLNPDDWEITVHVIKQGYEDEVAMRIGAVGGRITVKSFDIKARVPGRTLQSLGKEWGYEKTAEISWDEDVSLKRRKELGWWIEDDDVR
jgi:hypothetical protein